MQPEDFEKYIQESTFDINLADKDGNTLLHFCCKRTGDIRNLKILLTYSNLNINCQNNQDITPLMISTQKKLTHALWLLATDRRINFHIKDDNGKTAIDHASDFSKTDKRESTFHTLKKSCINS